MPAYAGKARWRRERAASAGCVSRTVRARRLTRWRDSWYNGRRSLPKTVLRLSSWLGVRPRVARSRTSPNRRKTMKIGCTDLDELILFLSPLSLEQIGHVVNGLGLAFSWE